MTIKTFSKSKLGRSLTFFLFSLAVIAFGWIGVAAFVVAWVLYQIVRIVCLPVTLLVGAFYAVLGGGR